VVRLGDDKGSVRLGADTDTDTGADTGADTDTDVGADTDTDVGAVVVTVFAPARPLRGRGLVPRRACAA